MREFIQELHSKNIYAIARVTVFQDPHFTKLHPELAVKSIATGASWKDKKGLSFLDVGGKETWDYTVAIARDASSIGFDEINFDYIRYPSDGPMKDIYFPKSNERVKTVGKAEVLREFFEYLHNELEKTEIVTSADLFGMTTTNRDDLNIGQVLENTLPYFDFVAPMVYPSHYPKNFNGWANPNDHVYELVHFAMNSASNRASELASATTTPEWIREKVNPLQLRTWIQDFDYGGNYDVPEIRAQIKATYDAGLSSWMVWSPSNRYTVGALEKE
jgi:hypothetical protein